MRYFSEDFLNFFIELAPNNAKDWFDLNRKRYEENVKTAFEIFVTDLIHEIGKRDKSIDITYKEAIFRINRDIRFSKDKQPYKLNRSAIISPNGRKDKGYPGLYIEMGPAYFRIYGGVYNPDKEQLYAIRETITSNPSALKNLMEDKKFVKLFGEIQGEKNKILPKEFKEAGASFPLLFNKQFYWFVEYDPEVILKDDLMKKTIAAYEINRNLTTYFAEAMSS